MTNEFKVYKLDEVLKSDLGDGKLHCATVAQADVVNINGRIYPASAIAISLAGKTIPVRDPNGDIAALATVSDDGRTATLDGALSGYAEGLHEPNVSIRGVAGNISLHMRAQPHLPLEGYLPTDEDGGILKAHYTEQTIDLERVLLDNEMDIRMRLCKLTGRMYQLRSKRGPRVIRTFRFAPKLPKYVVGKHRGTPDGYYAPLVSLARQQMSVTSPVNEAILQTSRDKFREEVMAMRPGWYRKQVMGGSISPMQGRPVITPLAKLTEGDVSIGDHVYWHDPDAGLCSGAGKVLSITAGDDDGFSGDLVYNILKDDGGMVEALLQELSTAGGNPA